MVIVLASAFAWTQKFSPSPKEISRSDVSERECKSIEVAMEVVVFFLRHVHDRPGATAPTRQTPTKPQTPSQRSQAANGSKTSESKMKSDNWNWQQSWVDTPHLVAAGAESNYTPTRVLHINDLVDFWLRGLEHLQDRESLRFLDFFPSRGLLHKKEKRHWEM